MTGLDAILAKIISDANIAAEMRITAANESAQKIQAEQVQKAEAHRTVLLESASLQAKQIENRGYSAAKTNQRNLLLAERNLMIDDVLQQALASLSSASTEESFGQIEAYSLACPIDQPATLILSARDLERMPADFPKNLSEKLAFPITVREKPGVFTFGCVVVCGEVEYDGTAEGILYDQRDKLRDLVNKTLFAEE